MAGLNTYDFGARQYCPLVPWWDRMDKMCEKHYNVSPYVYCFANPMSYIDIYGLDVHPTSNQEFEMIRNTIPSDEWEYVRLDDNGFINKKLINSFTSNSLNFNSLKELVNSSYVFNVKLDDKYEYMSKNGEIFVHPMSYLPYDEFSVGVDLEGVTTDLLSTGEGGFMGKTLFPDREGIENSIDSSVTIIINKNLSKAGAAEIYSHEANIITGQYDETISNAIEERIIVVPRKEVELLILTHLQDEWFYSKDEIVDNVKNVIKNCNIQYEIKCK